MYVYRILRRRSYLPVFLTYKRLYFHSQNFGLHSALLNPLAIPFASAGRSDVDEQGGGQPCRWRKVRFEGGSLLKRGYLCRFHQTRSRPYMQWLVSQC